MDVDYITPEQAGIPSENIAKYIDILEKNRLATHNVIMARGENIFCEGYWKPFHNNFLHRMYSVSKSFVLSKEKNEISKQCVAEITNLKERGEIL